MNDTIERLGDGYVPKCHFTYSRGDGYDFDYNLRFSGPGAGTGSGAVGGEDGEGLGCGVVPYVGFVSGFALLVCNDPLWLICQERS